MSDVLFDLQIGAPCEKLGMGLEDSADVVR